MAISKSAKIQAEIEKVTAKINEQQARLKELEQKKLEAENSEIVEIVRGMLRHGSSLSAVRERRIEYELSYDRPTGASAALPPFKNTLGHFVPRS